MIEPEAILPGSPHEEAAMDFKPYEYVVKVADLRSITKAAQALYVSQPYLSSYIVRLESELEVQLFDRTTKPLSLTYAGEKYLKMAREVLALHEELQEEIRHIGNHTAGRLAVGIPRMRATFLLPHILPLFYEKFPQVELQIREGSTQVLEELLKKGEIAFALIPISRNSHEFDHEVLYDEELILVTKKDALFPDAQPSELPTSLEQLQEMPFLLPHVGRGLRTTLDHFFAQNKFNPKIRFEAASNETLLRLASKGLGVTIVPHSVCLYSRPLDPIDMLHLEPKGLFWQIGIVRKKDSTIDYFGHQFIDICRQILPDAF